jgi:hypothetical protein
MEITGGDPAGESGERKAWGDQGEAVTKTARLPGRLGRRSRWFWWLGVVGPFLRLSRLFAQEENQTGYRHEWYVEDNDRMRIDTDSVNFNWGLQEHVRVSGLLVYDAISGATPLGAPPQSQWPYPAFANLYQTAYGQAYNALYNQYVRDNQIYVDSGYETYAQMTNAAALYAQGSASGVASNSAAASYSALTNSPSYGKNTVPLTHLTDRRYAFSLNLPLTFGQHLITPSFAYSTETDYVSYGGALNYSLALNQKNTTLNVGYAHNSDSVRDDKFIWQEKLTDDFLIGVVQLLSPKSYLTLNFTYNNQNGYLSDPYRGVMPELNFPQTNPEDPALLPEQRPRHRDEQILYASWAAFIDPLAGGLETSYRFFRDSWGINAHTVELAWHQKIGRRLVISPSFRYYYQTQADFYYVMVPDYLNLPPYYSSDYRLSELQTFSYGLAVTWRLAKFLSLEGSYTRYTMEGLDGATSQSAYPSANVFSLGLRFWF